MTLYSTLTPRVSSIYQNQDHPSADERQSHHAVQLQKKYILIDRKWSLDIAAVTAIAVSAIGL